MIEIIGLASTGKGTGFVEKRGFKIPYFIEYTCPGDVVTAKNEAQHKKYVEAELGSIIKKSEIRVEPLCKHYMICGGCNLLHIKYNSQVELKKNILEHIFERQKVEHPAIEEVPSVQAFNYRHRAKAYFSADNGKLYCGFRKRKTNDTIKIEECRIVSKGILEAINNINQSGIKALPNTEFTGTFCEDMKGNVMLYIKGHDGKENEELLSGIVPMNQEMEYEIGVAGKTHPVQFSDSFIQSNLPLNNRMVQEVHAFIVSNLEEGSSLLDLYAGGGNLSLALAEKFKVTFVEGDGEAFYNLKNNMARNNVTGRSFHSDVEEHLKTAKKADAVLLDPPRTGCGEHVIERLEKMAPKLIVYVSCDPVVTIKELKRLSSQYHIEKVIFIDMFPNTNHIEFITFMKLKG